MSLKFHFELHSKLCA